tara:strand:+ start:300 stop:473 length:174 start_codon:yes stop_codon:yes gene_type:complete
MSLFVKHYGTNSDEINLISSFLEIFSKTFFEANGKLGFPGRGLVPCGIEGQLSLVAI